jgi:hypothetical protein
MGRKLPGTGRAQEDLCVTVSYNSQAAGREENIL